MKQKSAKRGAEKSRAIWDILSFTLAVFGDAAVVGRGRGGMGLFLWTRSRHLWEGAAF